MTDAANEGSIDKKQYGESYLHVNVDIRNAEQVKNAIFEFKPEWIVHFAAESHVDNSILAPRVFLETNVIGTFNLLEAANEYYKNYEAKGVDFKFLHISTDEVFGELSLHSPPFEETTAYKPNSPYSASKASSDHIVRAFYRTYGLPVLISNCSNNYGPNQSYEKLIPKTISCCVNKLDIPVYGSGMQIRDWLFVEDHCNALISILEKGEVGQSYNIGGNCEISNLLLIKKICAIVDEIYENKTEDSCVNLITHIQDRLGHDFRYAINNNKILRELGWSAKTSLDKGLLRTVQWYINELEMDMKG